MEEDHHLPASLYQFESFFSGVTRPVLFCVPARFLDLTFWWVPYFSVRSCHMFRLLLVSGVRTTFCGPLAGTSPLQCKQRQCSTQELHEYVCNHRSKPAK